MTQKNTNIYFLKLLKFNPYCTNCDKINCAFLGATVNMTMGWLVLAASCLHNELPSFYLHLRKVDCCWLVLHLHFMLHKNTVQMIQRVQLGCTVSGWTTAGDVYQGNLWKCG